MSELRSWEKQADALDELGVVRVGISSDNVEKAAELMRKEQFSLTSIADVDLAVTGAYELLDDSGKLPRVTTILIDAEGTVRWIDLQPNYRKRASGADVVAAVRKALSPKPFSALFLPESPA